MLSRTLHQCLISCDLARLEAIARKWVVEKPPPRRSEAAAYLAERMIERQAATGVWNALTGDERAALTAIEASGGAMPWATFTRAWGTVRPMGPGRMARERPWEAPTSSAEGLWYYGLVYRIPLEGPTGLYDAAVVPDELRRLLPATAEAPTPHLAPLAQPPQAIFPATDHLLDDGCTLLAYVQNQRVRPEPDESWPEGAATALARHLRDRDPERIALLRHLAYRTKWLRVDSSKHLRPDPEHAVGWLQAPPQAQRAALATAWRESGTWNDLWHVPTLQPDPTGSWYNDPLLAREALLQTLAACLPGAWYAIAAFVAAIKDTRPDFQRPDGDYTSWYIRDRATGDYLSGFDAWDAVEGALIRHLITRPLAWLGLVDLGAGEESAPPDAFRLSPHGAAFLGLAAATEAVEPEPLVVRADLSVQVPAGKRYDRFQLSRVADWVRSGGPAYVYRLSAGSLAHAQEQGISVARVIDFLEQAAGKPLAPTLKSALARWQREGTEVRIESAVVLLTRDAAVMDKVLASPATRRFVRQALGPQAAAVAPGDWQRMAQALAEEGLLADVAGIAAPGERDVSFPK